MSRRENRWVDGKVQKQSVFSGSIGGFMNKIERIFCSGLHNLEVGVVYKNLKVVCNLLNLSCNNGGNRVVVKQLLDKYTKYEKDGQKYIFLEIYFDKVVLNSFDEKLLEVGEVIKPFIYDDRYLVTNYGRVWSNIKCNWLKQTNNPNGYLYCNIGGNSMSVHRAVALTFVPNPDGFVEVNHKDENKHNNCVDNLEWISKQDNLYYGTRLDRIKVGRNDRSCNSCEKKLKRIISECKDIGMSKRDVEEMIDKVVDEVFSEE